MGAVWLVFRAEFGRRWRSWLAIAFLISIASGIVLAATAAGRRTQSAFPEFVAAHGFDAVVYATHPLPKIASLPGVASAIEVASPDGGQPTCACRHPINPNDFGVVVLHKGNSFVKLVSGRMPDPSKPDQVLASFTLQQDEGIHLGSVIRVPFFLRSQSAAYNNLPTSLLHPRGPTISFRVVGFEATQYEFPSGGPPSYALYVTPGFAHQVMQRTGFDDLYFVRLRQGAAGLSRFDAELATNHIAGYQNEDGAVGSIERSINPQAVGWWILALLAALITMGVVGQALARQSSVEGEEYPALRAIGVDRRQLFALGMARNLLTGIVGAAGAIIVATLVSPIAPLGEARVAEVSSGIRFDAFVLGLGGLCTVAVVLGLGAFPAWIAARRVKRRDQPVASRPSAVVGYLAAIGAPPPAVIGIRNALQRRGAGTAVPVASAMLGTVLAVLALCGTAVFGASLANLTASPRLYGDTFQLNFSDNNSSATPDPRLLKSLEHNNAVTAITEGIAPPEIFINNVPVSAVAGTAIRGRLLLSTVDGHLPHGIDQIGLGAATMREVGAHIGSTVRVTVSSPAGTKRTVPFRVVSQISFPVLGGGVVSLGSGAALTIAAYESAACPRGPHEPSCRAAARASASGGGVLVRVAPGAKGQAATNRYLTAYRSVAALAIKPTSLINFGEAVNFPLIFGVMLALYGAATLVHLLVVSVTRRRREAGLLKVLGFVNRQVASTVAWQATTFAVVGVVIGVPVGLVIGRGVWKDFAQNLGVVPVPVVPIPLVVILGAGVLVGANLMAVLPALLATRCRPGELLRTA